MRFVVVFVLLFAVAAIFALWRRFARERARRHRLAMHFSVELGKLRALIQDWKKSGYDLVKYDSDWYGEARHWRTIELHPDKKTLWRMHIDPQGRRRLSLTASDKEQWYPKQYGWSDEQWLKTTLDIILFYLHNLPRPRTPDEWMQKRREEHAAFMAEHDRWIADYERRQAERGAAGFPSLDDPMDDMD